MENKKFHDKFGQEFKTGDIIEFKSFFHTHWGVYIGNGEFIDSRIVEKISLYDILFRRHLMMVRKRTLDLVEEKGVLRRNNFMDNVYEPKKPDEIVKTAEAILHLSKTRVLDCPYQMSECKYFALFCRYKDLPELKRTIRETLTTVVFGGITGYSLCRVVVYFLHL